VPTFSYTATLPSGQSARGTEKAASREAVELALYERDLRDIRVEPKTGLLKSEITAPRVKRDELMHLSRQLGAFIRAGLPLIDAVHTIGAESSNSSVRRMMSEVERSLRDGDRLSTCLDRHPRIFPAFYRGILRSAELTGRLDTVLDQLSTYLDRDLEARRKIKGAMMYPAVVAILSVGAVAILSLVVLPKFVDFFASLDVPLPLTTRLMLSFSAFVTAWWWAIGGVMVAAVIGYVLGMKTAPVRRLRDRLLLKVPVLGITIRYAAVERFTRLMGSMLQAGVPLPDALTVATGSLRNLVFERALGRARLAMLDGGGLAGPVTETGLFPGVANQMIRVGEETGTLDTQLEVAASYYERELDYKIKKMTTLIEPIVVLFMGLIVGFVAVALVSAMYGVFNGVKT
jgi:type IV pilus assembly protein PilC